MEMIDRIVGDRLYAFWLGLKICLHWVLDVLNEQLPFLGNQNLGIIYLKEITDFHKAQ